MSDSLWLFFAAMTFSSSFHERLEQMDRTRIQRLSLLQVHFNFISTCFFYNKYELKFIHKHINFQAEKDLQAHKSRILAAKLANIRAMEQRCLLFDRKIASQYFNILSLKSQIENFEAKYDALSQELRYTIVAIGIVFNIIHLVWLHRVWEFRYFG